MRKPFNSKSSDGSIASYWGLLFVLFSFQFPLNFLSIYWLVVLGFLDFNGMSDNFLMNFAQFFIMFIYKIFLPYFSMLYPSRFWKYLYIWLVPFCLIIFITIFCIIIILLHNHFSSFFFFFENQLILDCLIYLFAKTLYQYDD